MQLPKTAFFDNHGAEEPRPAARRVKANIVLPSVPRERVRKAKPRKTMLPKVLEPEVVLDFFRFFMHIEVPTARHQRKCRVALIKWSTSLGDNGTFLARLRQVDATGGKTVQFFEVILVGYNRPDLTSLFGEWKSEIKQLLRDCRILTATCGPKRCRLRKSTAITIT